MSVTSAAWGVLQSTLAVLAFILFLTLLVVRDRRKSLRTERKGTMRIVKGGDQPWLEPSPVAEGEAKDTATANADAEDAGEQRHGARPTGTVLRPAGTGQEMQVPNPKRGRGWLWALLAVLLLLFAIFVWPTLYRYDHVAPAPFQSQLVRINRLTGQMHVYRPGKGWEPF